MADSVLNSITNPQQDISQYLTQQWGIDPNIQGVNRADELAGLLSNSGITLQDLQGGMRLEDAWKDNSSGNWAYQYGDAARQARDSADPSTPWGTTGYGKQLIIGDKRLGYLGDVNNGGSYSQTGNWAGKGDNGDLFGWSAQGHGNVGYTIRTDPNTGRAYFDKPAWASSSDAANIRQAAVTGGAMLAGAYGLEGLGAAAADTGALGSWGGWEIGGVPLETMGKAAAISGGLTKASGGSWGDALKAGAIGGITAGIGTGVGNAYGGLAGGAAGGAANAALNGGSLADIARGGVTGGFGSYMPDVGGAIGINDTDLASSFNGAIKGGALSYINNGNIGMGAAMGGMPGIIDYGVNQFAPMPDVGTLGGTMADEDGENSATLGGYTTPTQLAANESIAPSMQLQSSGSLFDNVSNLLNGVDMPSGRSFGDMAQGLASMYLANRQRKMAKNYLNQISGNRGAYEQNLRRELQRRDAASGRRSNYDGRAVELQSSLAQLDSRNAPAISQLQQMQTNGLMNMFNSGLVTANRMGLFGGGQQPQMQQPININTPQMQIPSSTTLGGMDTSSMLDAFNRKRLGG